MQYSFTFEKNGYNPSEVDAVLEVRCSVLEKQREKAVLIEKGKVNALQASEKIIKTAEKDAENVIVNARRLAEEIIKRAKADAEKIVLTAIENAENHGMGASGIKDALEALIPPDSPVGERDEL